MANGSSTCDGHYTTIDGVFCESCGVVLRAFVLKEFRIISESPFWEPMKDEKCGDTCCWFQKGGMCRIGSPSMTFTHEREPACVFYRPV